MKVMSIRFITITDEQAGQRIDNFLITQLKGLPKSRIYKALRKGEVRVNKKRVKPKYRLQADDQVRIPPVRVAERSKTSVTVSQGLMDLLETRILYEDQQLLFLNKLSGLPVHGGTNISAGVIETLRLMRPQLKFLELVHRLDRDTSGCLLLAKKT